VEFVQEPIFSAVAAELFTDDAMMRLEVRLMDNPRAGTVIRNCGGARKLRMDIPGRGRSGGARIVYVYVEMRETIYLIFAYPKNAQADLTPDQERRVRAAAERIRRER
jgi:hypothetical protein